MQFKRNNGLKCFSRVERKPFSFSAKCSGFLLMRSKQEKSSSSNSSLMRVPIGSEKAFRLHAAQNRYRLIPNFLHSLIVRVDTGLSPQRVPTLLVPTHLTLNWASRLNIYSHPTIKHPVLIDYSIPHLTVQNLSEVSRSRSRSLSRLRFWD